MSAKVFVFGIDTMEPRLLSEWMSDGTLPTFASLRESATWGDVINPPRRFSGASWPNFYTGFGPGRHGQYARVMFDERNYQLGGYRPDHDNVPAFWLRESWSEKQIAVINMPYAPLHEGLSGLQLVDWGVHDNHDRAIQAWPNAMLHEVLSRFGGDPVGNCEIADRSFLEFGEFRDRLIRRVRAKSEMICHYLESRQWDLFISVLDETHCVGHQTWHIFDPTHPFYDREVANTLGNPIKDVYVAIDDALASVMKFIGDNGTLVVISSHGMGPAPAGEQVFDNILRRIEGVAAIRGMGAITAVSRVLRATPDWAQKLLKPAREGFSARVTEKFLEGDRAERHYFAIPTGDLNSGVRINLAGRESQGRVHPGEHHDAVASHLIEELHQLRDGGTGKPLVARVVPSEEIDFTGYAGSTPDFIVEWAEKSPKWIESPTVGRIEPVYIRGRTGDHRMDGIFFCCGPATDPGELETPVHLEDFAPTIARMMSLPIGETDGTPIDAIL